MNTIGRGFKKLADFKGRDRRGQFWPYAGVVIGLWFVVLNVTASLVMYGSMASGNDLVFLTSFFATMVMGMLILAGLLGAAIARRLHDRGHSGYWALIPLVCFLFSVSVFWMFSSAFVTMDGVDEAALGTGFFVAFLGMTIGNLIYMASLVTLIVFLCFKGKTGPNRYGPEPV